MTSSLELRDITKVFPDRKSGHQVTAVTGMSFSVKPGELVAVVGPSGCGKSTILNMVSGLYGPTEGQVLINDEPVRSTRSDVGFMLQKDLLLPWRNIVSNVEFGLEEKPMTRNERRERALSELERVRLADFAFHYPHQLSGGMRQRAALARTLAIDPEIVLLDEPFSALDAQTKVVLQKSFSATIAETGVTCLLITHDLQEAVIMSDRVVVLSGRPGTVVDEFPIELPHRDDPMARSMESGTRDYVKRLFDTLHLEDQAA
ncbi:ABC transporter ATP-binding protein [Amorphus sp. MBR-141]